MGRIRLLPEVVASQVAAGEVVERPASVVKELIENSLDAGAQKIDIIIRRGGISLVRVIDDGCGMDPDDALLSLERHATSKIRSAADLQAVGHPQIAFSLLRDDRVLFRVPAAVTLSDRIRDLYGAELLERLVEVNGS